MRHAFASPSQSTLNNLAIPRQSPFKGYATREFQKPVTLRHLRVIAALADFKLVARLAETLNVTQPAVSKQIVELEKIVGDREVHSG